MLVVNRQDTIRHQGIYREIRETKGREEQMTVSPLRESGGGAYIDPDAVSELFERRDTVPSLLCSSDITFTR